MENSRVMRETTAALLDVPSSPAVIERGADLVRPTAHGKFLFAGDRKLYVRGVTYGTFRPNADGDEYPDRRS